MNGISEEAKLSIKHGASFLDEYMPDWVNKINLDSLNMSDCKYCVIGQTMNSYWEGLDQIRGGYSFEDRSEWAVNHGFDVNPHPNWEEMTAHECNTYYNEKFKELEVGWTDAVMERLENARLI